MSFEKLERSPFSLVDDVGTVYIGENKIYRAINSDAEEETKKLLEIGLIDKLVSKNLFPDTEISNNQIDGYGLVLEHKKIKRIIYPYEWSPEMLRSAGNCILEVNKIANKYGYELKDAHPYNVLFDYSKPLFVDFGSIIKRKTQKGWSAYNEFYNSYVKVLKLVENNYISIYKHAFVFNGNSLNSTELSRINNSFMNFLYKVFPNRVLRLMEYYKNGKNISEQSIDKKIKNKVLNRFAKFILWSDILPFKSLSLEQLQKKLNSIKLSGQSQWGGYHQTAGFYDKQGNIKLSERMQWIVDEIKKLEISTVTEFAGNQGVISRYLSTLPNIEHVVCTDYDHNAIDTGFLNIKDERVFMANFDFIANIMELKSPERHKRLQSDLVIALAVTHHLVLTQQFDINVIFSILKMYCKKYIIIEFMPLGLWDGNIAPEIPTWYSEQWFESNFLKYFSLVEKKQLEENRIVFIGKVEL